MRNSTKLEKGDRLSRLVLSGFLAFREIAGKLYLIDREIMRRSDLKESAAGPDGNVYRCPLESLGLPPETRAEILARFDKAGFVYLAEFDQDGFLLSDFDLGNGLPTVPKVEFKVRKKFGVSLIYTGGQVCVRKSYFRDKRAFLADWRALSMLSRAGLDVPAVVKAHPGERSITHAYIAGKVLREDLAGWSSMIRDRDVEKNAGTQGMEPYDLFRLRVEEARRNLPKVVEREFIKDLYRLLQRIHELGFSRVDIKYGNVIIEEKSRRPFLVDLDSTLYLPNLPRNLGRILTARDIRNFRTYYGVEGLPIEPKSMEASD